MFNADLDAFKTPTKGRVSCPEEMQSANVRSVYAQARSVLRLSAGLSNSAILGRDVQRNLIVSFLSSRFPAAFPLQDIANQPNAIANSGALYLSGRPGTGKTLLVSEIINQPIETKHIRKALVLNCTTLSTDCELYDRVINAIDSSSRTLNKLKAEHELEQIFSSEITQPL